MDGASTTSVQRPDIVVRDGNVRAPPCNDRSAAPRHLHLVVGRDEMDALVADHHGAEVAGNIDGSSRGSSVTPDSTVVIG